MIIFILYIFVLIYVFEFYGYIYKLKKQLNISSSNIPNDMKNINNIDSESKISSYNYIDMSENVMESSSVSGDSFQKGYNNQSQGYNNQVPLPADDTRAYYNKNFEKLQTDRMLKRTEIDPRWHCLRNYMICDTPYNFLPQIMKPIKNSAQIWKNYNKQYNNK